MDASGDYLVSIYEVVYIELIEHLEFVFLINKDTAYSMSNKRNDRIIKITQNFKKYHVLEKASVIWREPDIC